MTNVFGLGESQTDKILIKVFGRKNKRPRHK